MATAALVVGFIVAALGPIGAYLAAARKLSGRIGTTDAEQLWTESRSLREDYREQLTATQDRQAKLEARVADLEKRNTDLARENVELRREAAEAERTIVDLRERVEELERENADLKSHLAALEARS